MFKFPAAAASLIFLAINAFAQTSGDAPLLIGRVSVNKTHIAFAYAGKIWLVERAGGVAKPLNEAGAENNPVFSPDGRQIAFSRWNGGDFDIYVSAATGGEARRLTFQNEDDLAIGWTPDSREIVFESTRDEEGVTRLHKVKADGSGALFESLPLPQAFQGSFSPDGEKIAYNPRVGFGEWRYYRGGAAAPVWVADLKTGATESLTSANKAKAQRKPVALARGRVSVGESFNDRFPMWVGDKIYFVSDRTGIFNLFVRDLKTKETRQLTRFDGQGIRTAGAADDAIVFVRNGRLHLFDLQTNEARVVNVSVSPDASELKPKTVGAMRFLESILPSANGEMFSVGARGEVLIFDRATGESKNLTNTSGAAERYPAIAPDGKSIAYFSDESGEYQLHVRSLETGAVKKIAVEPKPSFYWDLAWSPDSTKLAFADRRLNLWLADARSGATVKVDSSSYSAQENWAPNFSADSRFLVYAKRLKNRAGTVFVRDLTTGKTVQITDGVTHAESPVFDRNGKYLYFIASPNALTSEFEWGVLNGAFARPLVVRRVHALRLTANAPAPFLPDGQSNPDAKMSEISTARIEFGGLSTRFIDLPLPPRDYRRLAVGTPGKLLIAHSKPGESPDLSGDASQTISLLDFAKSNKTETIIDETRSFDVTGDGRRIMFNRGRDWFLTAVETAPKPDEGKLDLAKLEVQINPAEEWRQMFRESMRIMRDWFYDPNYHGQNLAALEREYAAYLPTTTRRGDLNALIRQMLGHVSVSHLGVGGGDTAPSGGSNSRVGLLGADYEIANGKIRFKKIYRSTGFASANGTFNSPLDQPGVDVRAGDYLLEVNGRRIETDRNLFGYFENTVGKPIKIMVSQNADGANPRSFTVYPAAGENRLRRANWAEENRRRVEQMSGGKLGYIFIENYDPNGIMNAIRGLTGYADRQGIIVDQRFNGGGVTPDYLIEWMRRQPVYFYYFRGGDSIATPVNPAPPVKVLLINEWNGSAAETGALMFKLAQVGKIVGKRTYGAGIGPYFFTPRLVDGGQIQLPNRAAYDPAGNWGIENQGVAPEFDVEITAQDFLAGKDSQLDKAIQIALAEIAKNKLRQPKLPAFQVHP